MNFDEVMMKKAMELAQKGAGHVSPNPLVGAVIVKDGEILAEGYHKKFGEDHAERDAINKLDNEQLKGATLYVNLEPCSHQGKTPPCADLIIEKQLGEVVIAMQDPNPLVAGKGIQKIRDAGISIKLGVLEKEARFLNRFFLKYIRTRKPYVILKAGITLDGFIATSGGESKWITSEESRRRVHKLRSEIDAVLVGKTTFLEDKPKLDVRMVEGRDPKKIILDTNLGVLFEQTDPTAGVPENAIICSSPDAYDESLQDGMMEYGSTIHVVDIDDETGRPCLCRMLEEMAEWHNITSILVEGGAAVHSAFVEKDLVDEIELFMAPTIFGQGKSAFEQFDAFEIDNAKRYKIISVEPSGGDLNIKLINTVHM